MLVEETGSVCLSRYRAAVFFTKGVQGASPLPAGGNIFLGSLQANAPNHLGAFAL